MAFIKCSDSNAKTLVRVLFDDGSQRSYVTTAAVNKIRSQPVDQELTRNILFDGSMTNFQTVNKHNIILSSQNGKNQFELTVREKSQIGGKIPRVPNGYWIKELKNKGIFINDVNKGHELRAEVDLVIGSEHWGLLMTGRMKKLPCGLTATQSLLGWTLSGLVPTQKSQAKKSINMFIAEENLQKLWNLDVIGITDPIEKMTQIQEEDTAKKLFQETVTRSGNGRYVVKLPWMNGTQNIPNNKQIAINRLMSATKKLNSTGKFEIYDNIFKSWIQEGFVEQIKSDDKNENCHYLPHHPVFKDSLTTPVRPVFDASCKSGRHPSLNDCLYKGPNCIELLPAVLLRFREKSVGVVSDIRKAFQMIGVEEQDREYLRFLWWEDSTQKIMELRHNRVVFGLNCSPYLLAAVIEHHLMGVSEEERELSIKILKSLYVDNCVLSVNSYPEYEEFKKEASNQLAKALMELRQWECTSRKESGIDSKECGLETNDIGTSQETKVLGLIWHKEEDNLSIQVPMMEIPERLTKRNIASVLHKIFDPIGFTCPALLQPKLILQKTWQEEVKWDKEIPTEYNEEFMKWCQESHYLKEIKIPRQFQLATASDLQIHTFCDASQDAYAAVIYLRSENAKEVKIQLLQAKSRVSPLGKPTIPRLELLGCLIGARLTASVIEALSIKDIPVYYWSDSTTAIAWINRNDDWGTFVGNRVKQIIKLTNSSQWRHVPGALNPADLPSRGCSPKELLEQRWWEGPGWLRESPEHWPHSEEKYDETEISKERKKTAVAMLITEEKCWFEPKFSSYTRNIRVMAWIRRFCHNCQSKSGTSRQLQLSSTEVKVAELDVIRIIQRKWNTELKQKKEKLKFQIINGVDGIMRLRTPITNRDDTEGFRYPILLPKSHPFVHQLIREAHNQFFHAGVQVLIGRLRERYWITQARRTISSIIHKCTVCQRYSAKNMEVPPAALPVRRVRSGELFDTTGVDLTGPFFLKDGTKAWTVLYTCAVYRAVHLDLVTSLSTESFMSSLQRCVHEFGRPDTIYSDNGTNFVGAHNLMKSIDLKKLEGECRVQKIHWIFNPPASPWYGGWWERLVRSMKDTFRKIIRKSCLTFDQLRTAMCAVAATINDRPLTTVTEDPNDFDPLTPAMFLRRTKNTTFPESHMITGKDLQIQYKHLRNLNKNLQERFRREYLSQLVQPKKIRGPSEVGVGDIVLVGTDNKKRFDWPLGRIMEIICGQDGKVRVVKVRTRQGCILRPLQRLYPLEMSSSESKPKIPDNIKEDLKEVPEQTIQSTVTTKSGRLVRKPSRFGYWNN